MAERKKYLDLEGLDYFWDKVKAWVNGSKQDKLVSGTNIKTVNDESLLGEGNIKIQGGGGTSDYSGLDNKPQINSVTLSGDKSSSDLGLQNAIDANNKLSYNYLKDTPSIPSEVTESTVSEWGFTKNTGTYSKPSDGIPSTDMTSAVQTSLGKADSAYQKPSGGIPSTDIASGVIPTVPTISTDIKDDATSDTKTASPKAVKDYVDGAIPTISTDITADAASDIKTASPKAVKTFVEGKGYGSYSKPSGGIPKTDLATAVQTSLGLADTAVQTETDPVFSASAAAGITSSDISDWDGKAEPTPVVDASTIPSSMEPNKLYKYGTLSGDTVFPPFATPTDLTIANVYWWKFTTPSTAPNITWPAGITEWAGGQALNIDASTTYEITVEDGFAAYIKS